MNKEDRITYEGFIIAFSKAPKLVYTLYDKAEDEIERLNNIINELEKWLNEYYKSNRKWYNTELSNHDKQYYGEIYRNTEFMIVKFLKQLKELKEE